MKRWVQLGSLLALTTPAWAHEAQRAAGWSWEPTVVLPLALAGALYLFGAVRLRRRGALQLWPTLAFVAGWLTLVAALDSPIDRIGEQLFWVHMTQHELLMIVAAPLLVLGRPLVVMLWALPQPAREALGRAAKRPPFSATWAVLSAPLAAWSFHAAALWLWHAPSLFDAALEHESVHALQHVCFLGSALLFWWTLVHGRHGRLGYGAGVIYVFTTAAHSSILGALLTFAPQPWYAPYVTAAPAWSLSALQDQQVGGLIMWVPACTLLVGIGLVLLVAWMRESERRFAHTRTAAVIRAGGGAHA